MSTVGVWMDFDEDGFDTGDHDDVTADTQSWSIRRDIGSAGSFTVILNDPDGIYNPQNAGGPLYGLLRDGIRGWIGVNADGTVNDKEIQVYGRAAGRCTDITPIPAGGADVPPTVEFVFEDPLAWIGRAATKVSDSRTRSQYDLRLAVLTDIGETSYSLEVEPTTLPLSGADGLAGSVLDDINRANGTRHFAAPATDPADWYGYVTIRRTSHLDGVAASTLDAGSDHVTSIDGWRTSADTVVNRQDASIEPIIFRPGAVKVWEQEALPLTVTGTLVLWPQFTDYVDVPVVNHSESGDALTVTFTTFGHTAKLELASAGTTVINSLDIRGHLVERGMTVTYTADDLTSQAPPRGIRAGSPIEGDEIGIGVSAQGIADHIVWRFGNPLVRPTLSTVNWFPDGLERDLTDVIAFTSAQMGVTARLFEIIGLQHDCTIAADDGTVSHSVVYALQESRIQTPTDWFTWGTTEWNDATQPWAY